MLQSRILGLLIRQLTQKPKLIATDLTHTKPRLLQQLHRLQRTTSLSQLFQLLETNLYSKLLSELDVHQVPDGFLFGRLGIVVWSAGFASGAYRKVSDGGVKRMVLRRTVF